MDLIDPALGLKLVIIGGWALALLGALKLVVYLVGELAPGAYARIRSETFRRFVTGKGNRLLFGLGGFLTLLLGLVFVILGLIATRLAALV
jgi:hypothetical protein